MNALFFFEKLRTSVQVSLWEMRIQSQLEVEDTEK